MPGCIIATSVAAPVDRVFAAAIDVPSWPRRIPGIKAVEMLTEGPVRVGTRIRETRIMFGREASEVMEFTAIEPNRRYELTCENRGCRYRSELRFEARGEATELTMNFEVQPTTMMARILIVLMRPMINMCGKEVRKDLEGLKRSLEAGGA